MDDQINDIIMALDSRDGYYIKPNSGEIYFTSDSTLTTMIQELIYEKIKLNEHYGVELGYSNVSESRYIKVYFELPDDSYEIYKLRISAHNDRYGSDATLRVDDLIHYTVDEQDELRNVGIRDVFSIAKYAIDEMVDLGIELISNAYKEVMSEYVDELTENKFDIFATLSM